MSQKKVADEMLKKTAREGYIMLDKYVRKEAVKYVPSWCRMIAENFPPKIYYRAVTVLLWVLMLPIRIIELILIKPFRYFQRIMWKFGFRTEVVEKEKFIVNIKLYYWFRLVHECDFDWRYGTAKEVE